MGYLHVFTYISVIIFVAAILARFIRIARAPVHLRWELYPVPHEKGRASYGGSRLEEVDWWTKKQEKDHLGELKIMIPEIMFLKGVWEHNKELWLGSFPFHFALYMFIGNMVLLIFGAILQLSGLPIVSGAAGLSGILYLVIYFVALIGGVIGILGSLRLLFSRITDHGLSDYSSPSHYFNIILIGAIYVTAYWWLLADNNFVEHLTGFYAGLLTFSKIDSLPAIGTTHIIISLVFIVYLPFTHMTHFFTKYFTYHSVRWEDEQHYSTSKIAGKIASQLQQTVTWAAPHIGADGKKNWVDIATSMPAKEKE